MLKLKPTDREPMEQDRPEPSALYLTALVFQEVGIKQEDFNLIREQSRKQSTMDEMLALVLASSIAGNSEEGIAKFSGKSFQGLCNTVKYLYDLNHARYDGEKYWFSPDKKILAQLKKDQK